MVQGEQAKKIEGAGIRSCLFCFSVDTMMFMKFMQDILLFFQNCGLKVKKPCIEN